MKLKTKGNKHIYIRHTTYEYGKFLLTIFYFKQYILF